MNISGGDNQLITETEIVIKDGFVCTEIIETAILIENISTSVIIIKYGFTCVEIIETRMVYNEINRHTDTSKGLNVNEAKRSN